MQLSPGASQQGQAGLPETGYRQIGGHVQRLTDAACIGSRPRCARAGREREGAKAGMSFSFRHSVRQFPTCREKGGKAFISSRIVQADFPVDPGNWPGRGRAGLQPGNQAGRLLPVPCQHFGGSGRRCSRSGFESCVSPRVPQTAMKRNCTGIKADSGN
ncbi:MAG: hypothetical protein OXF20_09195 [Gammaproteobacteria bacterium]|nr:hypothetical protein [Gammaproteobacteria bacterium]